VKKNLLFLPIISGIIFAATIPGCKKGIENPVTLDKAAGKWSINAVRYKIYNGTQTPIDSTIPWRPVTENFVSFDGVSSLEYCFNSATSNEGTYSFSGTDSIDLRVAGHAPQRWRVLLLTETNFNIETTSTDNTSFPGATVVTFQGFVR